MGLVLITHDMGVVAETAERVSVQYAGQKVEEQPVVDLFATPHHPYTAALLAALPERATERLLPTIPGRRAGPVRPARRAACSRRAASSPTTGARRRRRPRSAADLGYARCFYPLNTDERIAS